MSSDMDWRDTPRRKAAAVTERPAGIRQSSRTISPGWGGLNISMTMRLLVVIFQIDVGGVFALDVEGQPGVPVHPCRPAPFAVALEGGQLIAGQRHRLWQGPVVEAAQQ